MISKLYTEDWFGRTDADYSFNPNDRMKGMINIPNHKYSSFLYNEDKAERICSNEKLLRKELIGMMNAVGLTSVSLSLSKTAATASTNGKFIEIGTGNLTKSTEDCYEKLDRLIGLTIHESCHCLYTNFTYVRTVVDKYPQLVHFIHNVIEDEIIELKLSKKYEGYRNFLLKLKYDVFVKNSEEDLNESDEINTVLQILFYLIRYPKFISSIDEEVLAKHENLFATIKKILKDNKCFDIDNEECTLASTNAAIQIYELLKDDLNDLPLVGTGGGGSAQGMPDNEDEQSNDSNSGDNGGDKNQNDHNEGSGAGVDNNESSNKRNFNEIVENVQIIQVLEKIYEEVSSESECTSGSIFAVYHKEIDDKVREFQNFIWEECKENKILNNNEITTYTETNATKYNIYKNAIQSYVEIAKRLIIKNRKKHEITPIRFSRNGSLDPARLANAMCNEQTVYVRKETKTIDNDAEYAMVVMIDESGSMEDRAINVVASKLAVLLYEAFSTYPKIRLFVYGHGDRVYKYLDGKKLKDKYVLGNRRQQASQDDYKSYRMIIEDVRMNTNLPIVAFNITDSCYCSDTKKLMNFVSEVRNDKTFINLIAISHNENVTESIRKWNDAIYGQGNWVQVNSIRHGLTDFTTILKQMASIIKRTAKI